jgi:hypothetical protein
MTHIHGHGHGQGHGHGRGHGQISPVKFSRINYMYTVSNSFSENNIILNTFPYFRHFFNHFRHYYLLLDSVKIR